MIEETKNAAIKSQVKEAAKKEKRSRERELEDVAAILSTKQGRRVFWRYLVRCGVFKSSFTGSSQTFFNEGERNIGLMLLSDVNEAMPEAYQLMLKESKENS